MSDNPTTQQKQNAFMAVFLAPTLDLKRQAIEQYQAVLLRKYGMLEENIGDISVGLVERQGGDLEYVIQHGAHINLIDNARKRGIDEAFQKVKQNPREVEILLGSPNEGTVIAGVTYIENRERPHPFLNDGESVELVAFPDLLEVRKSRGGEELLSIPWNNVQDIFPTKQGKSSRGKMIADVANLIGPLMYYRHDGVIMVYQDAGFNSKMTLFFRVRGEKAAVDLSKKLMHRLYTYRMRMGLAGGS